MKCIMSRLFLGIKIVSRFVLFPFFFFFFCNILYSFQVYIFSARMKAVIIILSCKLKHTFKSSLEIFLSYFPFGCTYVSPTSPSLLLRILKLSLSFVACFEELFSTLNIITFLAKLLFLNT